MESLEIQPSQLRDLLASQNAPTLLDCREPSEYEIARLEPSILLPMNTIPGSLTRIESLADEKLLVVYCHHGVRSLNAAAWLRRQGVENVVSLNGGIDRWSIEIDPAIPRY